VLAKRPLRSGGHATAKTHWGRFWHVTLPETEIRHCDRGVTAHYLEFEPLEARVLTRTDVETLPIFTYYQAFAGCGSRRVRAISVIQWVLSRLNLGCMFRKVLKW